LERFIVLIQIKKLNDKAIIPTRGSLQAAGYDLYACADEDIVISPHSTVKVGTRVFKMLPFKIISRRRSTL
jgi:dUTP pyrophosphatase